MRSLAIFLFFTLAACAPRSDRYREQATGLASQKGATIYRKGAKGKDVYYFASTLSDEYKITCNKQGCSIEAFTSRGSTQKSRVGKMSAISADYPTQVADSCLVFFYCDPRFPGSFNSLDIYESDGKSYSQKLGRLYPNTYFAYQTVPGLHVFSISGDSRSLQKVTCTAGQTLYFRAEPLPKTIVARATLKPSNDEGPAAIRDLTYTVNRKLGRYFVDARYKPSSAPKI